MRLTNKQLLEDNKFKIRTGTNCGVHINISHEDKRDEKEISELFYAMMFEEASTLLRPIVVKEIKRLVEENAITLDGIDSSKWLVVLSTKIDTRI